MKYMKNLILIVFLFFMIVEIAHAAENTTKTAVKTPSIAENVSPEALFDKIRGFLTVPIQIPTISVPTPETRNFDASGIWNLNDQIREITGVDIFRFLNFLWNIFLVIVRYLLGLLPRTTG